MVHPRTWAALFTRFARPRTPSRTTGFGNDGEGLIYHRVLTHMLWTCFGGSFTTCHLVSKPVKFTFQEQRSRSGLLPFEIVSKNSGRNCFTISFIMLTPMKQIHPGQWYVGKADLAMWVPQLQIEALWGRHLGSAFRVGESLVLSSLRHKYPKRLT